MEQKTINHNPAFQLGKVVLTTWAVASGLVFGGAALGSKLAKPTPPTFTPDIKPSAYGIMTLRLTSDITGEAIINLDGFRVPVKFVFDKHPDYNGIVGSEFVAIEIIDLEVGQITDGDGNQYRDFTNFDDHRNINAQLAAYIEKNKLVELV
ncbi:MULTISPECIES: hypothetical protein [unclassified Acinetobacter]|uniref:hypothetical protein n=1 Tax=unclassified Acinetobacter TaxID=196816 RepID=UPI0024476322|nr:MULTISPECIES: hypothetical protein [unclassified Acinetobacter]MDH0032046.1 hypothetical protein [Acinetobacter sp. GD04021]MDH0887702.1 hypothetical protein [Acinetobacter sp. GD03873]MDH1084050.1 hypothetical protein [Acinetobacter sp. GD03983]MDH2191023.1 hypothetical protein [Acinetobacter sp. GD03645]MDH2204562.1 hypothetical protein [Acinetobacter sp. GD03647]